MTAHVFYGFKCSKCNSTTDVTSIVTNAPTIDDAPLCSCGSKMVANPQGNKIRTNVRCNNCNSFTGMTNADSCSNCGTPYP